MFDSVATADLQRRFEQRGHRAFQGRHDEVAIETIWGSETRGKLPPPPPTPDRTEAIASARPARR